MNKEADRSKREAKEERIRQIDRRLDQERRIEHRFRQAGLTTKQLEAIDLWERAEMLAHSWIGEAPDRADIVEAAMLMLAEVVERNRGGTLDEFIRSLPPLEKPAD